MRDALPPTAAPVRPGAVPVSAAGRFRVEAWGEERLGVATAEGHEATTGLPVRIRRFRGPPRGDPTRLDHPNLPGVVAVQRGGDETRLVTLVQRRYRPLGATRSPLRLPTVLDAADALAAVHGAGIVHGDLGPHRLLVGPDGHVLLDGVGAPWRAPGAPEATAADDVRGLAGALLGAAHDLPPAVAAILEGAATHSGEDLDAVRLARDLRDAAAATRTPPVDGPAEVVKDLPPGGVYTSGESEPATRPGRFLIDADPPPRRRWSSIPWRTLGLVTVAVVVGLVAVVLQDRPGPPVSGGDATSYVVDVAVAPPEAPPLEVVVVAAPPGSSLTPGTRLGRAPRRIAFDAAGRWEVVGAFGSRRSEPVAFVVPGAQRVTVTLPPDDPEPVDGPAD